MPNTYIQRTPSGGNRKKWTWSAWVRFTDVVSTNRYLWSGYSASNNTGYLQAYFHNDSQLNIGAWNVTYLNTTRLFRDPSAWYHIVIAMDTAQATASNRLKVYVNGVEETVFDTDSRSSISQDSDMGYNSNGIHTIGGYQSSGSANGGWNGLMSHVHFTDGYAYTPSSFGSTDATTGEWKINTSPSVSYGTTGYWIFKNDAGVTDQSPNSNNWTASGNLIPTQDNPSNVFATLNPLSSGSSMTFTNGNTGFLTSGTWESAPTTLAMSSGKYYCEFKPTSVLGSGNSFMMFGVEAPKNVSAWINNYPGYTSTGYAYGWDGDKRNNAGTSSYGNSFSQNDIIGIALDMDNKKLYFHKNGTYQNSGVPTSGSTGTGALPLTEDEYYFVVSGYNNGANATCKSNFGNGYFGTTAVSSAGTNASNNGIFEYDVPAGYTALSTKGLNL